MNEDVNKDRNENTNKQGKTAGSLKNVICLLVLSCFWIFVGVFIGRMFFAKQTAAADINKNNSNTVSKIEQDDSGVKLETKLDTLQEIIEQYYYYEDEIEPSEIEENVYKAYVAALNDKYSTYYSASELKETMESIEGTYYGIGAVVSQTQEGDIILLQVYENSPAEKAGLMAGDLVTKIDGTIANGMNVDEAVVLVKGEEGTKVTLTIKRDDKEFETVVTRGPVDIPSVYASIKDDNIGYVQITAFDVATTAQFTKEIEKLLNEGAKGLVLDLRNNGGGALDTAVDMLDYLLSDKLLVYVEDKYDNRQNYYAKEGCLDESIPIAVIINGNSASASEVFTGALQDWERAKVFGTKSFGKGVVQNLISLSDGSGIKITTSMYFTPLGRNFNGNGIDPDEVVQLPTEESAYDEYGYLKEECDTQLNAALSYVKNQIETGIE